MALTTGSKSHNTTQHCNTFLFHVVNMEKILKDNSSQMSGWNLGLTDGIESSKLA